ncbi:MAG: hypothetical protein Terrestrivirus10_26 [Terrestrivirus sp.]|uniref:Endonuclease/exonuclease/phosphatase domain-containing protein n=1 Tax=Terrestrivirus sp. TaxID=2487775 RepID=A0A3G4ZP18_9VIRU|nr:MAG: hypothetical protein Terrestrivirus10_26 [Terrestrivirus sp.]
MFSEYTCSDDYPIKCDMDSDNYGLCKKIEEDCNNDQSVGELVINPNDKNEDVGSKYGYTDEHLNDWCGRVSIDLSTKSEPGQNGSSSLPNTFKVMTFNIWGLIKGSGEYLEFLKETMQIRMQEIVKLVKEYDPDVVCIQEMTNLSFEYLKELNEMYEYKSEPDFDIKRYAQMRNRNVEVFVYSKYKPININIASISGNLGYNNAFLLVEYSNIIIINCYLQAGSKHSPGQENNWIHYSRCRKQELKAIRLVIEQLNENKLPIILTGDFNTDLGGNSEDWPELNEFKKINIIDTWKQLKGSGGLTEDTDINHMRWNTKFMEKRFRYDGILYKNTNTDIKIVPKEIEVIGKNLIPLNKELSEKFLKLFVPQDKDSDKKIKYYDTEKKLLALWPSDHFGVIATFQFINK